MRGQLAHEPLHSPVLAADDANVLLKEECRLQDSVNDGFLESIHDANRKTDWPSTRPSFRGMQKFAPNGEDFLSVAQGDTAKLGEHQLAALPLEELVTQDHFKPMDLGANRWMLAVEFLARSGNAPVLRYDPEVPQMMVIEDFHTSTLSSFFLHIVPFFSHSLYFELRL
jgi:hypothetical protein